MAKSWLLHIYLVMTLVLGMLDILPTDLPRSLPFILVACHSCHLSSLDVAMCAARNNRMPFVNGGGISFWTGLYIFSGSVTMPDKAKTAS